MPQRAFEWGLSLVLSSFCPFSAAYGALSFSAGQAGIAVHVVNQVAQMVVLCGSFQPDAPTPVGSHLRHPREDVLHSHSHPADRMFGLLLLFTQRMPPRRFAHEELLGVELDKMLLVLGAVVGAVGEHGLVFLIEEFFKDLAVMHMRRCGGGFDDELGFQVGLHMVLPAVVGLVVFLRPAGFAVLLPPHGRVGIELLGPPALFDALVLLAGVSLARGFGEAGVDDATFAGDVALGFELEVEGLEEFAAALASTFFESLLEVPDRLGVGDHIADAQAEEAFKTRAVKDLLLGGVVAEPVELLQHENLEHEHGVEGRLATFAPVAGGVAGEFFEQRAEIFPGDKLA